MEAVLNLRRPGLRELNNSVLVASVVNQFETMIVDIKHFSTSNVNKASVVSTSNAKAPPSWPVGVVKLWHKQFNHIKGNRNLWSYAQWYCKWA